MSLPGVNIGLGLLSNLQSVFIDEAVIGTLRDHDDAVTFALGTFDYALVDAVLSVKLE